MAKKQALGDLDLDFEESINSINGIPISINTEEKVESRHENTTKSNEIAEKVEQKKEKKTDALLEDAKKSINESKPKEKDISSLEFEKIKEEMKEIAVNGLLGIKPKLEERKEEIKTLQDNKPSTKKHLKEGYTRHTFAIKDEHLELIKALAEYKGIEQKQLLETLLNKAFESVDKKTKEDALNYLHNEDARQIDLFN